MAQDLAQLGEATAPAPVSERARIAVLELVCDQAVRGVGMSLLFLSLLCTGLWGAVAPERLLAWFAVVATISMLRYAIVIGFRHRRRWLGTTSWEHAANASLAVNAAAWGMGAALLLPGLPLVHQTFVFAFVIGLAAGTAALYSAQRVGASLGVALLAGPSSVYLGLEPAVQQKMMAAFGFAILLAGQSSIPKLGAFVLRSFSLADDLVQARDEAQRMARTDDLTGLANRRAFHQSAAYLVEQARRHERPLTVALVDVDHFKPINDRNGHADGDRVLRSVADALSAAGRQLDVIARVGGDEFAVLLPDASAEEATGFVQRFQKRLTASAPPGDLEPIEVTCSIGVAERRDDRSVDAMLFRADRALYRAKAEGRDRAALWDEETDG